MRPAALSGRIRSRTLGRHSHSNGLGRDDNGELLQLATANGFEAFITVDVNLRVAPDSLLCVLVLRAGSNRLESLLPLMPSVLDQLAAVLPCRPEIIAAGPQL